MKFLKNKAAGFYLLLVALVFAVISTIYYVSWAQANFAMNSVVVIAMAAGLAVNLLLLFVDSDYLVVILTALYGVGMIQLLVDNAGSFADAYQGIVMFGDPTQVGTVLTIAALAAVAALAVIVAGFMNRRKAA
ncbi:MAG TPA: hypothetical protein IAA71_00100 [Candidatus Pullichristensenella stercoripullorum]|nr:hypothetical protein [Candidatus Pullichristensenella stercoripullorum]